MRILPFRVNPPCLKTKELKQSDLLNLGGLFDFKIHQDVQVFLVLFENEEDFF